MKKSILALATVLSCCLAFLFFTGCNKKSFDTALPSLSTQDGWYKTLDDDFGIINDLSTTNWRPSPHGARLDAYWCDQTLAIKDGALVIDSFKSDNHNCPLGICPKQGIFTGGVDTYDRSSYLDENGKIQTNSKSLFSQAFGYYSATVKVPRGTGMWSAFWLQSINVGKIGNQGKDGTEIDIYESSFHTTPTMVGNAFHYDAYQQPYYKTDGKTTDVGYNLYDGEYHTYSLLWTPDYYAFYVDNKFVWASDFGGVSCVPEFLRLTVEIKEGIGPYGAPLTGFSNASDDSNKFFIKSVQVYQNSSYEKFIKSDSFYNDKKHLIDTSKILLYVATAMLSIGLVACAMTILVKKQKNKSLNKRQGKTLA